ncbi:M48 family metalloprotease [Streptomyces sp. NPDC059918]|uniref:M48 family metalloprotease n=1 Tax=Streptomyces sp. NPDC059918 TaxID=3347003 RepID=UPI00364B7A07
MPQGDTASLARTTVATLLGRPLDKGLVGRRPGGRGFVYFAVQDTHGPAARRMHRELDGGSDRSMVLARFVEGLDPHDADDRPDAFALPGGTRRAGRIVVTAGMLRALDPREREALLGHERAHSAGHHHVFPAVAQLAGTSSLAGAADPVGVRRRSADATPRCGGDGGASSRT